MHRIYVSIFYIGFASLLSQILLVREFLVIFYGNELSIGIIFASWLIWIGIGSILGNKLIRAEKQISFLFHFFLLLTPIITIIQIFGVKFVHYFVKIPTGEFMSIISLIKFSFIVLSIGCLLWGALFTIGAKLLTNYENKLWLGVNKAYIIEILGSAFGGLIFSFIFSSLLSTLQIIFMLIIIALILILWHKIIRIPKIIISLSLISIIIYIVLLPSILSIEHYIDCKRWFYINNNMEFVRSINTKYQNLSLLKLEDQYTVFADGKPAYNIPNTYDAELFTHSIMIQKPNAKRILIIGGGFNGVIKEFLKYPVESIDYIEIDPMLIPYIEPILDESNLKALQNRKLNIISTDGRKYLRNNKKNYDVIIIKIGEPSTASMNRYFTLEFYRQCLNSLSADGICAFSFPSSTEYLDKELKDLNASLYHTFKRVFTKTLIIPGTQAILIGTTDDGHLTSKIDALSDRFKELNINTNYFSEYMFEDLLLPGRIDFITNSLDSVHSYKINTDNNPITYYFNLLLWNKLQSGNNEIFFAMNSKIIFLVFMITIAIVSILLLFKRKKHESMPLKTIIACAGLIGMALNLLLLLNFQVTFGSIYEMVGAMVSFHMIGMVLGAIIVNSLVHKLNPKVMLIYSLLLFTGLILIIPPLLDILTQIQLLLITFMVTGVCGLFVGLIFGIINRIYLSKSQNIGSIYAFDVLGSSIGALLTCSILLPVLGLHGISYILLIIMVPALLSAFIIKN